MKNSQVAYLALAIVLAPGILVAALGDPEPPQPVTPAMPSKEQVETLRQMLQLPPGSKLDVEVTHKDGGSLKTRQEGSGKGANATADGDHLNDTITGSAPNAQVGADGEAGAQGGDVARKSKADALKVPALPWQNPLFWVGLALLGGCGFCVYSHLRRGALICGVAGAGLIAAAFYPIILLFAVAGVVLVMAGPYIKAELEKLRSHEALRGVVEGVDHATLPPDVKDRVKAAIALSTDDKDKKVIKDVKKKDELGKYAD